MNTTGDADNSSLAATDSMVPTLAILLGTTLPAQDKVVFDNATTRFPDVYQSPAPAVTAEIPMIVPGIWYVVLGPKVWHTFQIIHTLLTVIALLANCISLVVIYGIVARLTPPLQLLTSLAFADMLAPWAIMTMYFPASSCQDEIHSALLLTSHNSSALSLVCLALIHNVATFRPLHYEKIITQRRVWITVNVIWIIAIVSAHIHFLAILTHHDPDIPFCIQVLMNTQMALTLAGAIMATTCFVALLIYTRILLHLRPINNLSQEGEPRKSTRGVITGIVLLVTYLICWAPYLLTKYVQVRDLEKEYTDRAVLTALSVVQVFVLINSTTDPLIIASRMISLQTGYLGLYHKCRGWFVGKWTKLRNKGEADDQPSTPLNPIESIC